MKYTVNRRWSAVSAEIENIFGEEASAVEGPIPLSLRQVRISVFMLRLLPRIPPFRFVPFLLLWLPSSQTLFKQEWWDVL